MVGGLFGRWLCRHGYHKVGVPIYPERTPPWLWPIAYICPRCGERVPVNEGPY